MKKNLKPLLSLARELVTISARARALGMFVDDRELLTCPRCGLEEDVSFIGMLMTCRPTALSEDTGMRFEELSTGKFRCPSCGARVDEPPEEPTRKPKRAKERKPRK